MKSHIEYLLKEITQQFHNKKTSGQIYNLIKHFVYIFLLSCLLVYNFFLHLLSEFNYVEEIKGYTASNQGRAVLVDQRNFTYLRVNNYGKRINWMCRKYGKWSKLCKARASTYENYIMNLTGVHNHDPDDLPLIMKTENEIRK